MSHLRPAPSSTESVTDETSSASGDRSTAQSVGIAVGGVAVLAVCVAVVLLYLRRRASRGAASDYSEREMFPESVTGNQGSGVWNSIVQDTGSDDSLIAVVTVLTDGREPPPVDGLWSFDSHFSDGQGGDDR
jgi:hypothetical protein